MKNLTEVQLNAMQPWGIVRLSNSEPQYPTYAIKMPNSGYTFYLYREDEIVGDDVTIRTMLQFKVCTLVDDYQVKQDAIDMFHGLHEDHDYSENDYFFDGHYEDEEGYEE